jgi:hypothetical protein
VRRLRSLLALGWVASTLAIALPIVLVDSALAWATSAVAAALMLLLFAARWPALWIPLWMSSWALPSSAPWWRGQAVLRGGLEAAGQVFVQQPLAILVLTLAIGASALPWLVQRGGARHVRGYQLRAHRARVLRGGATLERWQALGPSWLFGVMHAPYRFWLGRASLDGRGSSLRRALLLLGPSVHWSGQLGVAVFVAVPVLSLMAWGMGRMPVGEVPSGLFFGMSVGTTMLAISALQQAPVAYHQTRREQALLMLVPGMPRGAELNRGFARMLGLHFTAVWLACTLVLYLLGAWVRVQDLSMLAMPVGALPLLGLLWRDWSRQRAPSPSGGGAIGLLTVLGGGAVFVLQSVMAPGAVLATAAAAALTFAAWRWRRLSALPQAWPTGRLG